MQEGDQGQVIPPTPRAKGHPGHRSRALSSLPFLVPLNCESPGRVAAGRNLQREQPFCSYVTQ